MSEILNDGVLKPESGLTFTGEFFVPGKAGERIEADHMARYQFAAKFVHGQSVLDVACGAGYGAPILLGAGAVSYVGADIQPELLEHARQRYGSEWARYELCDITNFDVEERYGVIACFETIEHVVQYQSALKNLYRALKPDGLLLISSPNRIITSPRAVRLQDTPLNEHHMQEFLAHELVEELRLVGFIVEASQVFGQRQRLHFSNRYLRKLAHFFQPNPDDRTSPEVSLMKWGMTPRYFVIKARKPNFKVATHAGVET